MFSCSFLSSLQVCEMVPNSPERPKLVSLALILLYFGLLDDLRRVGSVAVEYNTYRISTLVSLCLSLLFITFVTYKISQGRNWARITFLILMSITIAFVLKTPNLELLSRSTIHNLLRTIACVLLFLKPSSDWFRLMKESRAK